MEHKFYYCLTASKPIGGPNIPTCGYGFGLPSWPAQEFAVTRYILRGCRRCGGDLFLHNQYDRKEDWQCMQCGRYRHQRSLPSTTYDLQESPIPQDAAQGEVIGRPEGRDR